MSYEEMTLQELKAAAKELGIKGITGMKKGELVELLNAVKGHQKVSHKVDIEEKDKEDSKPERKRTGRRPMNKVSAKQEPGQDEQKVEEKKTEEKVSEEQRAGEGRTQHRPEHVESSLDSGKEANGILEVMSDGFGFIRCENYLPGDHDIYVSPAQIKKFNLKTGDIIVGNQKVKTEKEKFAALLYIKTINGYTVEEAQKRKNFEDLTPIFPNERIRLENAHANGVSMRIMDLLAPIGKGQRGMIVAPPKAGKTTLLKQIAISISRTYRNMHLIVLLIDERPEEVTDIRESIEGPNVEVIYSTFDELPEHHKRVSEMVLERAKRLVEHKEDVVILLDSITRLARAYNLTVPPSGRTLTGGLDPAALHMPKKFFGAARNMREGGSLTVLATALVETGSKMDDVVFEEFKGTGNMELVLDRKLQEKRIFPAIDVAKSGTRRDDLLLTPLEQEVVEMLHKEFSGNRAEESIEEVLRLFVRTKNNEEFLHMMKRSRIRR
ncbi:MAG: transcription termination factor Rho [Lachnospiraceae bacterium]|nr:transcription termination factor Rho [Lachnospiraceae bacterium]HCJ08478.1 transcription termination factor Rho [Lachnospiraceae bacterium]